MPLLHFHLLSLQFFLCAVCRLTLTGGRKATNFEDENLRKRLDREIERDASVHNCIVILQQRDSAPYVYKKGVNISATEPIKIASSTKLVSANALLLLVNAGTLNLDDHPQKHIPWWTNETSDMRSRITLHTLLSFTSGLTPTELCVGLNYEQCSKSIYSAAGSRNRSTPPGSVFYYSANHLQIAVSMALYATKSPSWQDLLSNLRRNYTSAHLPLWSSNESNPVPAGGLVVSIAEYNKFFRAVYLKQALGLANQTRSELDFTRCCTNNSGNNFFQSLFSQNAQYGYGQWLEPRRSQTKVTFNPQLRGLLYRGISSNKDAYDGGLPTPTSCSPALVYPIVSCPGAFGFYPWIDRHNDYYGIVGMQDLERVSTAKGLRAGIALGQAIQDLISAL